MNLQAWCGACLLMCDCVLYTIIIYKRYTSVYYFLFSVPVQCALVVYMMEGAARLSAFIIFVLLILQRIIHRLYAVYYAREQLTQQKLVGIAATKCAKWVVE